LDDDIRNVEVESDDMPWMSRMESYSAKYMKNLESERFKEPRMFTMEQIRNVTFACLNQSTLNDRMKLQENRHAKIFQNCKSLEEMDQRLEETSNTIKLDV